MTTTPKYLFERDEAEDERLRAQSGLLNAMTTELLDHIGLGPGWRVLDLGTGAGDVAYLAADRVGPTGSVSGIDRDPATAERAQADARRRGYANVEFRTGDAQTLEGIDGDFDAVVGRLIYMYVADPVEALRQAYARVRPGGLVCLQEADLTNTWAHPMTPLWQQAYDWLQETMRLAGVNPRMGYDLFATFRAAGLPDPEIGISWRLRGASELPEYTWADIVCGTLPLMEKFGVATREEVQPETLGERLKADLREHDGIMTIGPFPHAWTRKPF
ncbi:MULTISPECIES: class I SAM-dependent methyltransferase [Prauserella salsuginis group]|uniref:Class I SAM-dependent methyltransferase n=1 Tax=Prauserella salsuginis TaxID=387889 RepID=A0ABW6FWQ8_9PSEU|nr:MULTISPECIES: class I SAM-dependent methyltransferase [Prauserella salsuginis group]MCR3720408.1 Methyltransferase domain-containing protein [Prauserella flava]MCR3733883.1 Methyltransferase domain-containing protein [Prauserella salsuginis]